MSDECKHVNIYCKSQSFYVKLTVSSKTEALNQDLKEGNERVTRESNTNWGIATCEPTLRQIPRTYMPGKRSGLTHTVSKLARPVRQAGLSLSLFCNDPEMGVKVESEVSGEMLEHHRVMESLSDAGQGR
ncbi:hypothetical protein E2C01_098532 [Portunus trituberculatus]|uniref:Uncharacterized protein n=1 Tax=Portunus trituberculatus TaxID=210409 RepID=A0A5B7K380_PORTR|nr:hypothetical protein [Portunus trituberculatus]